MNSIYTNFDVITREQPSQHDSANPNRSNDEAEERTFGRIVRRRRRWRRKKEKKGAKITGQPAGTVRYAAIPSDIAIIYLFIFRLQATVNGSSDELDGYVL